MSNSPLKVGLYYPDARANVAKLRRCLRKWRMSCHALQPEDLGSLQHGDIDVLLLPGGWYGIDRIPSQDQHVRKCTSENQVMEKAVRRFVRAGGGIVGVCCGAFNVVWMGFIKAEISRTAGMGMHSLEARDGQHPVLAGVLERAHGRTDRRWLPLPVMRWNGPILFPKHPRQMILSYDWEHRLGAVLCAGHGRGRAVAISPHPEMTEHETYDTILHEPLMRVSDVLKNAILWAAGRRVSPR